MENYVDLLDAFGMPRRYATPTKSPLDCRATRARAKKLMLSGVPISAVATSVGYSEYRTFWRAWRRRFGQTPRQWLDSQGVSTRRSSLGKPQQRKRKTWRKSDEKKRRKPKAMRPAHWDSELSADVI